MNETQSGGTGLVTTRRLAFSDTLPTPPEAAVPARYGTVYARAIRHIGAQGRRWLGDMGGVVGLLALHPL